VASVHSIVSWDFAVSIVPGWHTTIFAPYFVAGAILSGTAMVLTLTIPMRRSMGLDRWITVDHFEGIAKILLFTSLIVGYTIGDDVSSRSIEGENPLYLPQAKMYLGACAIGPGITPAWAEANDKLYVAQTQDTPCIATAEGSATDVMKTAKTSAYARTSIWYEW